jgi:hypothetical protein
LRLGESVKNLVAIGSLSREVIGAIAIIQGVDP